MLRGSSCQAGAVRTRSVVVVDDNDAMRMLLAMHLEVEGYQVVGEAVDAEAGLARVLELTPDVVVLDEQLPLGPGTRVIPEMKAGSPGTRIILFSADASMRAKAMELGADHFMLKGEPLSELTTMLGS